MVPKPFADPVGLFGTHCKTPTISRYGEESVLVPPERTIIVKNRTICPIGHFLAMKRSAHPCSSRQSPRAMTIPRLRRSRRKPSRRLPRGPYEAHWWLFRPLVASGQHLKRSGRIFSRSRRRATDSWTTTARSAESPAAKRPSLLLKRRRTPLACSVRANRSLIQSFSKRQRPLGIRSAESALDPAWFGFGFASAARDGEHHSSSVAGRRWLLAFKPIPEILTGLVRNESEPADAVPLEWAHGVNLLQQRTRTMRVPAHRWGIFIDDARCFLSSPWPARAAKFGWDTDGLFASRFPNPHEHLGSSEPIQEVGIHGQGVDLVKRRSMRRIIARRMKAATVVA
jgi:hypothetical protein